MKHHQAQKRTQQTRELEVEAEAEGSHDVKEFLTCPRKTSGGNSGCSRNLPGRDRGVSLAASAGENLESSLGKDQRPSIIRGR